MAGCSKIDPVENLLDKMSMYGEFELIDVSQVPEEFIPLLGVDADYDGRILRHKVISANALHLQEKRRKLAIAAICRHKGCSQEKEKKSSKRKEKEIFITDPLQKSLQGAIQEPLREAIQEPLQGAIQEPLREEHSCQLPVASCPSKALDEERTTTDDRRNSSQSPAVSHQLRENCEKLTAVNEAQAKRASEPAAKSKEQSDGGQFSFREFRDLWNKWAEHFGVAQFQRLNDKLREKFKTRQASFKREGAETEEFWINLLSAVAETSGGFYLGNNDGYRHCGTPWIITAKWLLDSDEHIERFLNAVA